MAPYIEQGIIELTDVSHQRRYADFNKTQLSCYNDALAKSQGVVKWLAAIDTDEFLFLAADVPLISLLGPYEKYGGLMVNWQLFGTSDVEDLLPGQLQIEALVYRAPVDFALNRESKSLVRPECVKAFINPHFAEYLPGWYQVNTDCMAFSGLSSPYVQINRLRINHYWTRTKKFFREVKMPRWISLGKFSPAKMEVVAKKYNQEKDTLILRYVDRLKECLNHVREDKKWSELESTSKTRILRPTHHKTLNKRI